jgi:hypothetical protein
MMPPPLDLARPGTPPLQAMPLPSDVLEEDNSIVVGLKVYTKKTSPSVITGRLKTPTGAAKVGMGPIGPPGY